MERFISAAKFDLEMGIVEKHSNVFTFKWLYFFKGQTGYVNECKARKVISVVYEFFVLQCTVFGF